MKFPYLTLNKEHERYFLFNFFIWVVHSSVKFGKVRLSSGSGSGFFKKIRFGSVPFGSVRFGSVHFRSIRFGSVHFRSIVTKIHNFHSICFDTSLDSA